VAPNSTATFRSAIAGRGAALNVPEAANYSLVYSLDIPNEANYLNGVTYNVDRHAAMTSFSRVAYYLELQPASGPLNYIWVSMDAFTNDASRIGVPTVPSGAVFQQPVANMNVASSVETITPGQNLAGGNIEFWPSNYTEPNAALVPNASDTTFDWGDTITAGSYGSMQIHNADASQVLFAFNNWGGSGGTACVGIGNNPSGQPDWTFAGNASSFTVKTLQVYVLLDQKPFSILTRGFQSAGNFKVTCEAKSGSVYSLWRNLDLKTGTWTKVTEATATENTVSLIDTQATNAVSFYEVRTP
jgi:sialate O-acetylesterase